MPNWVDLPDLPTSGAQVTYQPNPFAGGGKQPAAPQAVPQAAPQYAPQQAAVEAPLRPGAFSVVPISGVPVAPGRSSASTGPEPQAQPRPQGGQNWVDIPWGAPAQPERPGYIGELDRAVSRGVVNQVVMPVSEAGLWGAEQFGADVGPAREWLRQRNETFQERYAPSVPSVTDIHGAGDAARYGVSAVGELVPFMLGAGGAARAGAYLAPRILGAGAGLAEGASAAEIAAAQQAARTGAQAGVYGYGAAQGGLQGAVEAAKQYDDPGAAAVGGAIGAAAGLVPGHIIVGQAGAPVARRVLQGSGMMGGVGLAGAYAHPLAGVAAGQEYVPPTAAQAADAFLQGAIGGGVLGAAAGRGVSRGTPTVETPADGVNAATKAALNDQLKGPAPAERPPPGSGPSSLGPRPPPSQYALPGFDVAPVSGETPAGARGLYGPEPAGIPGGRPVPAEPVPAWDQRGPPPEINPAQPRIPGIEPTSPEMVQDWLRNQQTSPDAPTFNVGGLQVPGDAPLMGTEWRMREPGALPGPPPPDASLPRGVVRPPENETGFRAEKRALPFSPDAPLPPRPEVEHPPGSAAAAMQSWLDQFPGQRRPVGEFSVPEGAPFLETNARLQSLRDTVGTEGSLSRPLNPNAGDRVPGWVADQRAPASARAEAPAPTEPLVSDEVRRNYDALNNLGKSASDLRQQQAAARSAGTSTSQARPETTTVVTREPEAAGATGDVAGFTTSKGSTYQVHDDGTTTRNKSYHPEHGVEDVGPKARSTKTIYVDTDAQATALSSAGMSGSADFRLALRDGKATLARRNPDGKWGASPSARDIPFSTEPAVGKRPVEVWHPSKDVPGFPESYARQHAGNAITEVRQPTREPATKQVAGRSSSDAKPIAALMTSEPAPQVEAPLRPMPRTRGEQLREKQRQRMAAITAEPAERTIASNRLNYEQLVEALGKRGDRTPDQLARMSLEELRHLYYNPATPPRETAQPVTTATVKAALRRPGRDRVPERVAEQGTELAREHEEEAAPEGRRARLAEEVKADLGQTVDPEEARAARARESTAHNERAALAEDAALRDEALDDPGSAIEEARTAPHQDRPGAIENVTTDIVKDLADAGPRKRTGSNLDRKLADLEADIVRGRDPHDANRAYPENTRPRTRPENYSLARWLDHRIRQLEDGPGNERAVASMAEAGQRIEADRKAGRITKEQYEARSQNWRDQFDMITNKKYRDPEYVAKLKEARAALDKPEPMTPERQAEQKAASAAREAHAAEAPVNVGRLRDQMAKVAEKRAARKKPGGGLLQRLSESALGDRRSYDPNLHRAVTDILEKSGPEGDSGHSYLDAIVADKLLNVRAPEVVALAKNLKRILPDDFKVYGFAEFRDKFGIAPDPQAHGVYGPQEHAIAINKRNPGNPVVTLLHETVHAATSRIIEQRSFAGSPEAKALAAIQQELKQQFLDRYARTGKRTDEFDISYAAQSPHEVVSMLMTEPSVQKFAASVKPSAEFKNAMRKLGYDKPAVSVWQSFVRWTRKMVGLDANHDTLLDAVMRPLTRNIEGGAAFNRLLESRPDLADVVSPHRRGVMHSRGGESEPLLPKDPELRRTAELAYHMSRSAAPDASGKSMVQKGAEEALRVADPRGKRDIARKGWLQATGLDTMTRVYKDTLPALVEYGKKIEAENKITRELRNTLGDGAIKLLRDVPKAERNDLARLMNDATLNEVSVKPGADNAHVENPASLKDIQDRFAALSDRAQKSYLGINDMYEKMYKGERDASLKAMIRTALPEGTEAQRAEAFKAISKHSSPDRIISDPALSDLAKEFGDTMKSKRSLLREVARIHALGHVRGDYFPLARYGDYVVNYTTKAGEQGTEFFERHSDAQIRRKQLVEADMNPSPIMSKRASRLHALVPEGMGDRIQAALGDSDLTAAQKEQVQDAFSSTLLQYAARSQAVRNTMRRQGIEGASTDIERALSGRVHEHASRMGWLEHGTERMRMLADMHRYVDALEKKGDEGKDLIAARAVIGELEKRAPLGDDAAPGTIAHRMRQASALTWVYSLMSPSQTVINTAEAHATALAHVGGRHGAGRTTLALGRALSQIAPAVAKEAAATLGRVHKGLMSADWNLSHYARDRFMAAEPKRAAEINTLFGAAEDAGLMGQTMSRDLLNTAMPDRTLSQGWWEKFLHYENVVAHAAEDMNRSAVLKAAYDLELKKNGGNRDQAVEYGLDQLRRVFPNYNPGFRPRITTTQGALGSFAAPVTQFKNYGLHTYGVLADTIHRSLKGMDPQDRHEARMALAYFVATRSLMAGALTWLDDPIRWLGGAYDFLFTDNKKPHDYRLDLRDMMAKAMGAEAAEIAAKGVPHALGMDWSKSAGAGNMLNFPDMEDFSAGSFAQAFGGIWFGAAGQDAVRMGEGMRKMFHGNFTGGLLDVLPVRMVRDAAKAHGLATEGLKDQSGQVILPPSRIGAGAVAAQALGFRPPAVTEFRERRAAIKQDLTEDRDERSGLMRRWAGADAGDRVDVMDDVREYNRANRSHPITRSQLLQEKNRMKQAVKDVRTGGLNVPKARQREAREVGSFAVVQ